MENKKSNLDTYDIRVGDKVKVVSSCVDFYFFNGETGTVVSNNHEYLGINVKFDSPRHYEGYIQSHFNFNADNLEILNRKVPSNDELIKENARLKNYIRLLENEPVRSKSVVKRLRTQTGMDEQ